MPETAIAPAPSAAASNPNPAAPAVTPSVPPPATPTPLKALAEAELIRMATASLDEQTAEAPVTPPAAPTAPGPESPPAAPVTAESVTPPVQTPELDAEIEPTAEERATLSEAGINALRAERQQSKAARAEVRELKEQLAKLTSVPAPAQADPEPPAAPAAPRAPVTRLDHCQTPEQVAACTLHAAQQQALAMEMNALLTTEGLAAVVERFAAEGVETIGKTPLAQVTAAQMSALLSQRHLEATTVLQGAEGRKAELERQGQSFRAAVALVPELATKGSEAQKRFANLVRQFPQVKQLGPQWPQMVAYGVFGMMTAEAKAKTNGNGHAATVPPPTAPATPTPPPPRPAPGAPRVTAAAVPPGNELGELSALIRQGKASSKQVERYTELSMAG